MKLQKGARPIWTKELFEYYQRHNFTQYSVDKYCEIFYNWIINSQDKTITGLDRFAYRSGTQGTSQSFDNFVLRHAYKKVVNFAGDFQYHACISKNINHEVLSNVNELKNGQALIISFPFSDTGSEHKDFREILQACNRLDIPVCLDIAYWGIAKDLNLDLNQWSCIQEVVSSLSKPFYVLETHRVGVRFCRDYADDGICMINEVGMSNSYSMSLGCWFMTRFSNSYNWEKYNEIYYDICNQLALKPTNTVIFGLGDQQYSEFFRGIPGNHRVCISEYLNEN